MVQGIDSFESLRRYIAADLARYSTPAVVNLAKNPQNRWLVQLRITEWWCNPRGGLIGGLLRWLLQARSVRLGYTIPINRLGEGIRLPHYGTIVINGAATVGSNCQILPDVILGGNDRGAPTIGDGVFVGPGVKVIGSVSIGDGAVLLPGAVVVTDVPPGEVWGGVPAASVPSARAGSPPPAS